MGGRRDARGAELLPTVATSRGGRAARVRRPPRASLPVYGAPFRTRPFASSVVDPSLAPSRYERRKADRAPRNGSDRARVTERVVRHDAGHFGDAARFLERRRDDTNHVHDHACDRNIFSRPRERRPRTLRHRRSPFARLPCSPPFAVDFVSALGLGGQLTKQGLRSSAPCPSKVSLHGATIDKTRSVRPALPAAGRDREGDRRLRRAAARRRARPRGSFGSPRGTSFPSTTAGKFSM